MTEIDHRAALAGDQTARVREEHRLRAETRVIDATDRDSTCFKAVVHDAHDYEEEVWSEPRWVNPRTIWKYHCPGVRDESPYPTVVRSSTQYGIRVWKQDPVAPEGEFAMCRSLGVGPSIHDPGGLHVDTEVWKSVPREWPPTHVGQSGAGLSLSREETVLLRDYLNELLEASDD